MTMSAREAAGALAEANDEADADGAAQGAVQPGCTPHPGIMVIGRPRFMAEALAALGQLHALPTGQALMRRIGDSGRVCVVMESDEWNYCSYTNGREAIVRPDGRPGEGSNACVRFNPELLSYGFDHPWETRPPPIALGHEMIHALHAAEGTIDRRLEINDGKLDDDDSPAMEKFEELRTVGIPPHDADPITENALRREWSTPLPRRIWY